ncbi:hypothetical protein LX12_004235 [Williamsia serinedens]|uniref:Uncharacterized protein n=1 Tax=Williamsia serinedens TaxID=391736 RepID=A0ABT1H700_9NOCA|nr:hypothetical protein [Williamsia serinedens]MCP2163022.1 hypothetical protein [Williamsia serinedens]
MTEPVSQAGAITGTPDTHYDLYWFIEKCLNNALRLQTFIVDAYSAGDTELATLFEKAKADSQKGAEQAQRLLYARLWAGE